MRDLSHHRYTWEQYVSLAEASNVKLEFFDGQVFAMAGGTPEHSELGVAVAAELKAALTGKPCRVFNSDLRIRVSATGLATYPDVSVVCGELRRDPGDKNTVTNPVLLVEITSESSQAYDRNLKFEHYRQIETLQEYVLISHREQLIEVYRRPSSGDEWLRSEARTGARAKLESIGCELAVESVYPGNS